MNVEKGERERTPGQGRHRHKLDEATKVRREKRPQRKVKKSMHREETKERILGVPAGQGNTGGYWNSIQ